MYPIPVFHKSDLPFARDRLGASSSGAQCGRSCHDDPGSDGVGGGCTDLIGLDVTGGGWRAERDKHTAFVSKIQKLKPNALDTRRRRTSRQIRPPPCTITWLLGTRICCPSVVCAYCRMVAPPWPALAMVSVCRPCMPSVPLLAIWMAPPWVMATAEGQCVWVSSDVPKIQGRASWKLSHYKTSEYRDFVFNCL